MILALAIAVPTWTFVLASIALAFFVSSAIGGLVRPMQQYKLMNADEMPPNFDSRIFGIKDEVNLATRIAR